MQILLDANLVGRYINTVDPQHQDAVATVEFLVNRGHELFYTPQVEAEFCSFSTRPTSANGFGYDSVKLDTVLNRLEIIFTVLAAEEPALRAEFRSLRSEIGALGKKVHDIRHVAACKVLGVTYILTWNHKDFAAAEAKGHIMVLQPALVLSGAYPFL